MIDKLLYYIEKEKEYYIQFYGIEPRYIKLPENYWIILKENNPYVKDIGLLCGLIVCPSRDLAEFKNIEIF